MTDSLPPSALYVEYVLEAHGPLSRQRLLTETGLPERTLRFALRRLREADRVMVTSLPGDARQHLYTLLDR